jgi:lycopene beta-cyclase
MSGLPRTGDGLDAVVVGGGLSGGLTALALASREPPARVALVERATRLGGNHTWSFFESDLSAGAQQLVAPLIGTAWQAVVVIFPGAPRRLEGGYASISSAHFDAVVRARVQAAGGVVLAGAAATAVEGRQVTLEGGSVLRAPLVVDARDAAAPAAAGAGYQKFVGLEVELAAGDAVAPAQPVLMDATVAQDGGYRFMYVLPLGGGRALYEDTTFADGPDLDRPAAEARVRRYLAARGLTVARVLRVEHGVLPMPWRGMETSAPAADGPVRAGMAAGWFHPATGYSLPVAARLALLIAGTTPAALPAALQAFRKTHERQARFARLLNRMLFQMVAPERRWTVFARFFALPPDTIRRFFRLETTAADRARILCGPPASLIRTTAAAKEAA